MLASIFDGRERTDNALVIGDVLLGVQGNVEVNLEET